MTQKLPWENIRFLSAIRTTKINYNILNNIIIIMRAFNIVFFFHLYLQGLPSCPVSLEALRSHLPYLGYCLNFSEDKNEQRTDDDNNTNNNNNFVISDLYGNQKDQFAPNLTPLHRFYREQQQRKKMPGFRGRRGLCGCFQVRHTYNYWKFICFIPFYTL